MADIKPSETEFDGYRFRSRLEARWAVFFKDYGIAFEYELEGYKLPSGLQYLPDFYLPHLDTFVEVKPHRRLTRKELTKITEFALEGDKRLLLIVGTPTNETIHLIDRRHVFHLYEFEGYDDPSFTDEELAAAYFEMLSDATVHFSPMPLDHPSKIALTYSDLPPYQNHRRMTALLKAKQARFEFGEQNRDI